MLAEWMIMATIGLNDGVPQELGDVAWGRDLEAGLEASKESNKPVLLLFQEIPGCATCRNFGDGPLTHPLLVDAIENEFHPVAIYNNRDGEDARVLKLFSEPAWNNPVMRFVDSRGVDVIPRRDGVYGEAPILQRLEASLLAAKRDVPRYLTLAALDSSGAKRETAVFAMHCYWQGEAKLGGLAGVTSARCGWYDGKEVVEVTYRPDRIGLVELAGKAHEMDCAGTIFVCEDEQLEALKSLKSPSVLKLRGAVKAAKASDQRYYLSHSPLRYVPMTETQSLRVNSALAARESVDPIFSPSQLRVAAHMRALHEADSSSLSSLTEHPRIDQLKAVLGTLED